MRLIVGAIAFANFAKESRETFIQFFSFVFYKVIAKTLAFCPRLPNIHPRLSSFDCIFVYCFFGELFYLLTGNFREPCRHFFENKSKNVIVVGVVMVTLLYHPFLLLYHYYAEIVILSTNQNSEISRLIL